MPKIDLGSTDKRLGEYIRECRESRHLSQPMIVRVLDIDQQQLSRYENGLNRVSLHLSVMLADVFGQTGLPRLSGPVSI
jgi:transcriptional regulator with XRE-family HTH domain